MIYQRPPVSWYLCSFLPVSLQKYDAGLDVRRPRGISLSFCIPNIKVSSYDPGLSLFVLSDGPKSRNLSEIQAESSLQLAHHGDISWWLSPPKEPFTSATSRASSSQDVYSAPSLIDLRLGNKISGVPLLQKSWCPSSRDSGN